MCSFSLFGAPPPRYVDPDALVALTGPRIARAACRRAAPPRATTTTVPRADGGGSTPPPPPTTMTAVGPLAGAAGSVVVELGCGSSLYGDALARALRCSTRDDVAHDQDCLATPLR